MAAAALAHTLRDKVEAAYRRGDLLERRAKLMAERAAYLCRPASASVRRSGVISVGENGGGRPGVRLRRVGD
jgi:tRNA U34 5-methylaminomethyl-2-thiouridine-forming methyltransferase MnmC